MVENFRFLFSFFITSNVTSKFFFTSHYLFTISTVNFMVRVVGDSFSLKRHHRHFFRTEFFHFQYFFFTVLSCSRSCSAEKSITKWNVDWVELFAISKFISRRSYRAREIMTSDTLGGASQVMGRRQTTINDASSDFSNLIWLSSIKPFFLFLIEFETEEKKNQKIFIFQVKFEGVKWTRAIFCCFDFNFRFSIIATTLDFNLIQHFFRRRFCSLDFVNAVDVLFWWFCRCNKNHNNKLQKNS